MHIIIPYRNRKEHLDQLLPVLNERGYRPIVVEQANTKPFNRGALLNFGFKEVVYQPNPKEMDTNFVCFHDVDMVPEKTVDYFMAMNYYHLATAASQFGYKMPYPNYCGGVTVFHYNAFEKINGFSNMYWGWGKEDDDLLLRVKHNFHQPMLHIPNQRFTSLPHLRNAGGDTYEKNNRLYAHRSEHPEEHLTDGLNSLRHISIEREELEACKWVKVDF